MEVGRGMWSGLRTFSKMRKSFCRSPWKSLLFPAFSRGENHVVVRGGIPFCLLPLVEVEIVFRSTRKEWTSFFVQRENPLCPLPLVGRREEHLGRRRASCPHFIIHRGDPFLSFTLIGHWGRHFGLPTSIETSFLNSFKTCPVLREPFELENERKRDREGSKGGGAKKL